MAIKQKSKTEVDFEKFFKGSSSPKLRTTKVCLLDLVLNFFSFKFGEEMFEKYNTDVQAACVSQACQKKRKRQEHDTDSEESEGTESEGGSSREDEYLETEEEQSIAKSDFNFKTRRNSCCFL